ncbi:putative membrane protein [Synechococcus sp. A15-62]|nr:putative membrane protein [Synechococcus sp. A15-62]
MKSLSNQTQMGLASLASTVAIALLVIGFMGMAQHINASLL